MQTFAILPLLNVFTVPNQEFLNGLQTRQRWKISLLSQCLKKELEK